MANTWFHTNCVTFVPFGLKVNVLDWALIGLSVCCICTLELWPLKPKCKLVKNYNEARIYHCLWCCQLHLFILSCVFTLSVAGCNPKMVVKICFYLLTLGKIQEYVTQCSFAFSVMFELYKIGDIDYTPAIIKKTTKTTKYVIKWIEWIVWCNSDL